MFGTQVGRISGLNKSSMIDWEGRISHVIFLSGCGWRCPYCHNHSLDAVRSLVTYKEIIKEIKASSGWIDGIVICGGEPCLYEDVIDIARGINEAGFEVKVDTNGSRPEILEKLIRENLIAYAAMDIKTALKEDRYEAATGRPGQLAPVRESMELLINSSIDFEFRTTAVPGLVDINDIEFNLRFIPEGSNYVLQQYSEKNAREEDYREKAPYSEEKLLEMVSSINDKGVKSWLRG